MSGGELVRPYECPERWDHIMQQLHDRGLRDVADPQPLDMAPVEKVHNQDYLQFLAQAWSRWEAEDYAGDAIPAVIPARRMRQKIP
ncbi:MAG: histone deacetylase family protein, partial [Gammaproteobacteria bacterium]|nr:histone deacetylase family protein [Gammaproteobacteria bacterium]